MKKILLSAAVMALGSAAAFAGNNMGIGVNIGAAPVIEGAGSPTNFILGVKYQFQPTDLIRLEADADFGLKNKGTSTFNIMANEHFMIPVANQFSMYPLAGIGYGRLSHDVGGNVNATFDKFAFNIGVGAEYDITKNFGVNFEFKYQYMADYNRLPILVGATYKF
ncbi:MAG: porin family protein [Muribaculaceae bacterium]|nr:porin family protein [Muribaculaceae bacterium]